MLIPIDHFKQVYRHILQQALQCEGQGVTTYLICSNDTDSLCALKILTVSARLIIRASSNPTKCSS
jgi:hypothetical protein